MRILIAFFMFFSILSANLTFTSYTKKDLEILRTLDIDLDFLVSKEFNGIKESSILHISKRKIYEKYDDAFAFTPMLKDIMAKEGVPMAFLHMAMAESEMSTTALSKKKATGIWQFMPQTAKLFGLKIDKYTDERKDPIKSTKAAARYLKELNKKFDKWYLAALAYNCGDGCLDRAIKKAGTNEVTVLLDDKKKFLPKESRDYLRKILSLAMAMEGVENLVTHENDHMLNIGIATTLVEVKLRGGTSLSGFAKSMGLPLELVKKHNAHIKNGFLPNTKAEHNIYIPYNKLTHFNASYSQNISNGFATHTVGKGESLASISKKYGIPKDILQELNGLKTARLKLNQKIIIPHS